MKTCLRFAIVMAAVTWLTGCVSVDSTNHPANSAAAASKTNEVPSGKLAIHGGIASWRNNGHWLSLQYDDGSTFDVYPATPVAGRNQIGTDIHVTVSDHSGCSSCHVVSIDGRPVIDSELWVAQRSAIDHVGPAFLGATRTRIEAVYQGCKDGKIYTSSALAPVMRALNGEASTGEAEVTATKVSDEKWPVCNWRNRVGLDAVMPSPEYAGRVKLVPPYDQHLGHLDVTGPTGSSHMYFDAQRHVKKLEVIENNHSIVLQTPSGDGECEGLEKCTRAQISVDHGADVIIDSLDERPIMRSRLYEAPGTAHAKRYYACQGGKLYVTKTRASAETELKIAEQNPATPADRKGPPIDFKDKMTTESGVVVVPDQFCDWNYRAEQDKKLGPGGVTLAITLLP